MAKKDNDNENNDNENNDDKAQGSQSDSSRVSIPKSVKLLGIPLPGMTKTRSQDKTTDLNDTTMDGKFNIKQFDGKNFTVWRAQIEAYLTIKGCITAIKNPRPNDAVMAAAYDGFDNFARATLLLALSDEQAILVCHLDTAKKIWDRLLEAHQQTSKVSLVVMQRQFFEATMSDNEKVIEFVSRVQRIYTQLVDAGSRMTEDTLVARIVAGLSSKYHIFITNWANTTNAQTMAELIPRLMSEEALLRRFKRSDGMALMSESRTGNSSGLSRFVNKKVSSSAGPSKPNQEKKTNQSTEDYFKSCKCYNCNEMGHISRHCKKPQKPRKQKNESATVAEAVVAEAIVVEDTNSDAKSEATVELFTIDDDDDETLETRWILDTGASDHMCFDRASFTSISKSFKAKVKLGNESELPIEGVGDVMMQATHGTGGKLFRLKNVLFVPGLRRNLISINVATSNGANGVISQNKIVISKGGATLFVGVKHRGLYRALVKETKQDHDVFLNEATRDETSRSKESDLKLWHERLAHLNRTTIMKMQKANSVVGLEQAKLINEAKTSDRRVINCDSCCTAKHSRLPIPLSERTRASEVGERVHLDICGPVGAETIAGSKYFILFKDEFSNYRFIFMMKSREEAYGCLEKCIIIIESQTKKKVRAIMSDQGSEFTSKRSQELLRERSIVHITSAAFTPQQNGFIERDNRTVMEAARAMLFHRRLPEALWGEAANVAIYTLNRTVNSNTNDKTPFELFHGRKPRISHIRVFGSLCYVKAQEKKRSGYQKKLEARSRKLVLVGYDENRDYTYKLFDPVKKDFLYSREVRFDENKCFSDSSEELSYQALESLVDDDPNEREHVDDEANIADSNADIEEPLTYKQAINCEQKENWVQAMTDEIESQMINKTWKLVDLPRNKQAIRNKWVFKLKRDTNGQIARYKARLCAKGFSQKQGIDYNETFAPVVRMESIRLLLSIVAEKDLDLVHFDVSTAFLYGELEEEVYMYQPDGFSDNSAKVCRLLKSLYGLKQASRVWNQTFVSFLKKYKLEPIRCDSCILIRRVGDDFLIIGLYVDDGLAASNNKKLLQEIVSYLQQTFKITLMQAECFVGLQIIRDRENKTLLIHQLAYAIRILSRFDMLEANAATTPMNSSLKLVVAGVADGGESMIVDVPYREIIGSLMYLMTGTRPDIACAVSILSRFCHAPKLAHYNAAKAVLRYIVGTKHSGIMYSSGSSFGLSCFSDADYASCQDSRKSITGYVILNHGGAVVWKSSKQATVAESTTEAEFVACSSASRELVWCRQAIEEIVGKPLAQPTPLFVDNQSAIRIVKNNQINSRIKHLDIRMMAVREREENKLIAVQYVSTHENTADIFTKPLPTKSFGYLRSKLGMIIMLICLMVIYPSDAIGIKFKLKHEDSEMQKVFLKLSVPCDGAIEAEEDIRGLVESSERWKADAGLVETTRFLCNTTYVKRILPAFKALDGCLPKSSRSKRDVGTVIAAANTLASIVIGVTNFIRGSSVFSLPDVDTDAANKKIMRLEKRVTDTTMSTLLDRGVRNAEEQRELSIVSETALDHLAQIQEELDSMPTLVWMTSHIVNELHAGVANLKVIKNQCSLGRLATQELGEMIENKYLMEIDPDRTSLESVTMTDNMVEFLFLVEKTIEITLETLLMWTGFGATALGFMVILLVNVSALLQLKKKKNIPEINVKVDNRQLSRLAREF